MILIRIVNIKWENHVLIVLPDCYDSDGDCDDLGNDSDGCCFIYKIMKNSGDNGFFVCLNQQFVYIIKMLQ